MSDSNEIYIFMKKKINMLDKDEPYSRAACAKLRRAAGKKPGASMDIMDIMLMGASRKWDSINGEPSFAEWAVHTALTMYALHRQGKDNSMNAERISFGTAAAWLVKKDEAKMDSVRRRFNVVATALNLNDLAHHVRSMVRMFRADDIKMDYPLFAKDLFLFQLPGGAEKIRLKWSERFYGNIDIKQAD